MGSPSTELNSPENKSSLIEKFLAEIASIHSPSERQLRINKYIEEHLKELIEEQQKFQMSNYELPFSKLLLKNAIETLKKGITQFMMAADEQKTDFKPNPEKNSSSQKLKPRQQQETGCKHRKRWSPKLHQKFIHCLEQLADSEVATKLIKELMKVKGLTNRELESYRKQRKIWSHEQHKKFISCLPKLGGPEGVTPKRIKELMQEDELTTDDVKAHLKVYSEHMRKRLNARTSSNLSPKSRLQSKVNIGSKLESDRKPRKIWSREQHKKFVSCLPELGGPEVATPTRIKELMQEDELTTDDVKAHLKMYSEHIRKMLNARTSSNLSPKRRLQSKVNIGSKANMVEDKLEDAKEVDE